MCTLLALVPPKGGVLQIAANRDEFLARPASPPSLWPGQPAVLAPKDELAGGTWLGVNAHGLFVGITNRHAAQRDASLASRGRLVAEALRLPSVEALHQRLQHLGPRVYNPFHLLYADAQGNAGLTFSDGERVHQRRLGAGLHVLTERSLGAGDEEKRVARANAALADAKGQPSLEGWKAVLAVHGGKDVRDGMCIHAPEVGYGTRSAFLLEMGEVCETARCLWTEGPPCTSAWVDGSALLKGVLGC
jgi:uncharacterized protein with NRDE domain